MDLLSFANFFLSLAKELLNTVTSVRTLNNEKRTNVGTYLLDIASCLSEMAEVLDKNESAYQLLGQLMGYMREFELTLGPYIDRGRLEPYIQLLDEASRSGDAILTSREPLKREQGISELRKAAGQFQALSESVKVL